MRPSACSLVPLLCALSLPLAALAAGRDAPVPLEQAQRRAKVEHRALVVEISASWCGPCKILESQVLTHPAVRRALAGVSFIRYDAEVGPGIAAARTLSVIGFPTLVARAQDGSEISRIQGVPGPLELSRWLKQVAEESEPTEIMEVQVRSHPEDGQALLALSRRYRKQGDLPRSQAALTQALKVASGTDETVAATADWSLRLLHLQEVMRLEPRKAMIEHLLHYPQGPQADAALMALVRLGPADDQVKQALTRYIDTRKVPGQEDALNQAVYACLRVMAYDEAEHGARKLLATDKKNAMYLDTMAEVLHLRGDSKAALQLEDEALATLPAAATGKEAQTLRAELSRNQERFRRGKREPPDDFLHESDDPFPWEQF